MACSGKFEMTFWVVRRMPRVVLSASACFAAGLRPRIPVEMGPGGGAASWAGEAP